MRWGGRQRPGCIGQYLLFSLPGADPACESGSLEPPGPLSVSFSPLHFSPSPSKRVLYCNLNPSWEGGELLIPTESEGLCGVSYGGRDSPLKADAGGGQCLT